MTPAFVQHQFFSSGSQGPWVLACRRIPYLNETIDAARNQPVPVRRKGYA